MSRSALALCLLAAVCGAAHPSRLRGLTPGPHGCIVGGEPVDISQFPWQVSLEGYIDGSGGHFCGGSIISSTWVLTAAHCTLPYTPQQLIVRAGSSIRETGGTAYGVANIIQHQDYIPVAKDYDIALLEISKPIAFGSKVQAVILGRSEIVSGTKVNISGWGLNSTTGGSPEQLHAVTTTIIDRDTCREAYAPRYNVTESMICAGEEEGGKGVCMGDSGGPLVAGNTQYGVVSWGMDCASSCYPQVYANVPAARSWITEKTGVWRDECGRSFYSNFVNVTRDA